MKPECRMLSLLVMASLVLLTVLACQAIGMAEVVDIPDPNLRKVLEETLQINAGQGITKEALAGLKHLYASNGGLTNLSVLKYCTGLTRLNLSYNKISSGDNITKRGSK